MKTTWLIPVFLFSFNTAIVAVQPAVSIDDGRIRDLPARGHEDSRRQEVGIARAWMPAVDALVTAHRQAGLVYAIVPPEFRGSVGPFEPGNTVRAGELMQKVAEGTGTRLRWINNVAVFDPPVEKQPGKATGSVSGGKNLFPAAANRVSGLDRRGDSSVVAELTRLAGSKDKSTSFQALAALQRMEGDFMRNTYPGRVSILEVLADKIDRKALLYALEEGGPTGSRNWKLAVELLGRSRERVLGRHLWRQVWKYRPGAVEIGMWALGRCGDPSGGWGIKSRLGWPTTNEPSHPYLAAMALGQLNGYRYLKRYHDSNHVENRRAFVFGLGFCHSDNEGAVKMLLAKLDDEDGVVRILALHALARIGNPKAVQHVRDAALNDEMSPEMRAAGLEALTAQDVDGWQKLLMQMCEDKDEVVRRKAAKLAYLSWDPETEKTLLKLAEDRNRWVRCAAICSLARRGTGKGLSHASEVISGSDSDADEKISALLGLGYSRSPDAARILGDFALDPDNLRRLRRYAVLGLVRLQQPEKNRYMARLADMESDAYMQMAVRYLDLATPEDTAEYLIPYLTHAGRSGSCAAAGRLAEMRYAPALQALLEGSDVFDNHTRMMHMWGAVRAKGRDVTMELAEAASSPRSDIRNTAALALGGRLYPESVQALIRLAGDPDADVRKMAVLSLGITPDPKVVDVLIDVALNDESTAVSIEAARALRRRDFRNIPRVKEALAGVAGSASDPGGIAEDRPRLDEQEGNTFVLRTWDDHVEENLVCNLTYESSMCFDSYNNRTVMWGAHGRRVDTPQQALTWFYDARRNDWTRLTRSRDFPNGACCIRGTAYDAANKTVISPRSGGSGSHGWHNALRKNLADSSPWVLDVTTDQWYAGRTLSRYRGGFMPGSHDPFNGVTLWWKRKLFGFDVYGNRWFRFKSEGSRPRAAGDTGGVFDPVTGDFIAIGGRSTWAFSPSTGKWEDLEPGGEHPPPCPMVYDSASDVMLAFKASGGEANVWVYHIRENRWEKLPPVFPAPGRHRIWDVAYDSKNNVVVMSGQYLIGWSAALTARETWTYRYRRAGGERNDLARPSEANCVTKKDGTVTVRWKPVKGDAPDAYRIEYVAAEWPWAEEWQKAGEVGGAETSFVHKPKKAQPAYYRVVALAAGEKAGRPSFPARTAPKIVTRVAATVRKDGTPEIQWEAVERDDIVGYHLYRAAVDIGFAWARRFPPGSVADKLKKITDEPVSETFFVDKAAKVEGPADAVTWPGTYAYVIKAVNAWGEESGASPVTLALPDAPGPVTAIPWADGRRMVIWGRGMGRNIDGYHLMRMDDWHSKYVFRLNASPLSGPVAFDNRDIPTGDRRRYYASGVDKMGAIGVPSSGAWSHGLP